MANNLSSSGHKLGQIIGDWYEEYFAVPLLEEIADSLGLYLDHRFKNRSCRGSKILWEDSYGNSVDYDFVLEIDGSDDAKGIPVAFFETFWRRGARHSKDKARDDSGKLMPIKQSFPTARIIGIISAGDFTEPARDLVMSRGIDLFYVEKNKIIEAWKKHGVTVDYQDNLSEVEKSLIAQEVIDHIANKPNALTDVAVTLRGIVGETAIKAYKLRLTGRLGATPQHYQITIHQSSEPIVFESIDEVSTFLSGSEPSDIDYMKTQLYTYEVVFADGDSYFGEGLSWEELSKTHEQLEVLIQHMDKILESV